MLPNMTGTRKDIWVIVPAYNEGKVIADVLQPVIELGYNVVVVDDCSSDSTSIVLQERKLHYLKHAINLGQGAALQTGISYALEQGAKYLVTFDADGQHNLQEIDKLVTPLISNQAEIALGSRFLDPSIQSNVPPLRRKMLKLATWLAKISNGIDVTDAHNGFRALSAAAARKIQITQNRMAHASQILSQIMEHKIKYIEVPVSIKYTEYSLAKGQKLSNSFNILWESFTEILRR